MINVNKNLTIFILGVISGIPLAIILVSVVAWLQEAKVDIAIITSFTLSRIPYSLKFFWAHIINYYKIPLLCYVGQRKSWMLLSMLIIGMLIYIMGTLDPKNSLLEIYLINLLLGITSATFDIVYDTYRIEFAEQHSSQILSSTHSVFGHKFGMIITCAGSMYLADIYDWSSSFTIFSILYTSCTIYVFSIRENNIYNRYYFSKTISIKNIFAPFKEFFIRKNSWLTLLSVFFFKLGESMLYVILTPFYLTIGFNKSQIASITHLYGFVATILGIYFTSYMIKKLQYFNTLIISGIIQSVAHIMYIWLNHIGNNLLALVITVTIENFASAMGATSFVAYLSNLCNKKYSTVQYALFSSTSSILNGTVVMYSGVLLKYIGWDYYFLFTMILAFPSILLLAISQNKSMNHSSS
ncbi:MFS transporter [Rickettsia endosymbiont of Cardiosporidium cionae]|uniref:MFS transporter n=1 Tax=Rickettsia endosymbiont of Cardiosporidium cionae TaxID=2777155 RepID=UPI00189599B7|nr:MFS transporter [Rickettsia endosymbiont of Cardiosporidium cionae]KAF8818994.1 MFS transporter [Rickettsia endosymbiont of Cardiosporidium cionae]